MRDAGKSAAAKEVWLKPKECAKRTGLTVRALRVYERYGLVKARRMHNDWRCYGKLELERLNTITVLKSVGMTLAQIRDLVREDEPTLDRVLEIQVKAWRTKKSDAERGLLLAQAALNRVQSQQSLSIDAMCNLIRGMEMSDQLTIVRNFVQDNLTPEETRAVTEFMKRRFDLEQVKAQVQGQENIFRQLRQLMDNGVNPSTHEVQRLLTESKQIETRHRLYERMLEMVEWDASIGMKFYAVKWKRLKKLREQPETAEDPSHILTPKLWDFFLKANKKSPSWKPMSQLMIDVTQLCAENPDPTSSQAQSLVTQFRSLYAKYSLGDPDVYAKLLPYMEGLYDGWPQWMGGEDSKAAWLFLAEAIAHDRQLESN